MNRISLASLLVLLLLSCSLSAQTVALTNARVIDGIKDGVQDYDTIIIRDGLIAGLGTAVPADVKVIDMQGRYVLPGLMDAHTHVSTLAGARRALASGVTTVRSASTGNFQDVGLAAMVEAGELVGPEVFPAGTFVTPVLGDRALADPRMAPLLDSVWTDNELRHLVRLNADRGAKVIKTRATERAGLPDTDPRKQVYSYEQLKVIVDEAAEVGLKVLTHAHGDEGARDAVRAGVHSIDHGTYITEETLQLMVEQGTYLVPTYSIVRDLMEPGGEYDNPTLILRGQHMEPNLERVVRRARELGIPVVASTDSGYGSESVTRVSTEVVNFVKMGFTPFEAIQTATTVAAELLEISDRTGSIAVGMEADLIAVPGNPLEDIRVIQDVVWVMSNGKEGGK